MLFKPFLIEGRPRLKRLLALSNDVNRVLKGASWQWGATDLPTAKFNAGLD